MFVLLQRVVVSAIAGIAAAIVSAVVIAIADIYVTEHHGQWLNKVGDDIFLAITCGAAVVGWIISGRALRAR